MDAGKILLWLGIGGLVYTAVKVLGASKRETLLNEANIKLGLPLGTLKERTVAGVVQLTHEGKVVTQGPSLEVAVASIPKRGA